MSNEQIKQELHELIANLAFDVTTKANNGGQFIGAKYSPIQCLLFILRNNQKPKEKTLEEKLIDADFKLVFENTSEKRFLKKHIEIHIHPIINHYSIYSYLKFPNVLYGDLKNHDQIFADIAYLENRPNS